MIRVSGRLAGKKKKAPEIMTSQTMRVSMAPARKRMGRLT